jgi:N6-adenosine-specific RNA methylase IME4
VDAAVTDVGLEAALAAPAPFVGLRRRFYGAITIDPPSRFSSYTSIQSQNPSSRRDNERHYRVATLSELAALPIRDLAAPSGCHLFVWSSGPFLVQAIKLIELWGFQYSSRAFTWLKTKRGWDGISPLAASDFPIGLGLTTRSQSEFVLLARRGNCRRQRKDVRELILAPRREHSRKPDEFYRRVEA